MRDPDKDENSCGQCNQKKHVIEIDDDLNKDEAEETALSEILHACCGFAGMLNCKEKMTEEEFVHRLSPILHSVLRENGCWFKECDSINHL